jgi:hypothetical protein
MSRIVKSRHFWIEMILTAVALSCALGLLLASIGAAAGAGSDSAAPRASSPAENSGPLSRGNQTASGPENSSAAQTSSDPEENYEGMITDTHCGAKHQASIGKTASDCARACVHAGAQFALINGDKTYTLSGDLQQLKHAAGSRAKVVGVRHGDTIDVASIRPES